MTAGARAGAAKHERRQAMKRFLLMATLVLLLPVAATATTSTSTSTKHSKSTTHPKVSLEAAQATAQAKVPEGKMTSHELEKEHGKLIYSFEFKVPGESGVREVHVDAMTGKVINIAQESGKTEKHEESKASHKAPAKTQPKSS
jgi:uncharacterized membrane protein YkoI